MKVADVIAVIEQEAPLALQESYDNSGLVIGSFTDEVTGVLITLDITMEVIREALATGCNMIVSHHPMIFGGLKRITDGNPVGEMVITAIRNHLIIYSAHTNIDMVPHGVSGRMCQKIGLVNTQVLEPRGDELVKLVTFVPVEHAEKVRSALFSAGAGVIGNYNSCSYNITGTGTFKAGENTNPFVGEKGSLHEEAEIRIETVLPRYRINNVVAAMTAAHPYEEVAYDLYPLENKWPVIGLGMIGELKEPEDAHAFLLRVKQLFEVPVVRHTRLLGKPIRKVAVCGGSGSSLLGVAKTCGADVFISGDFKYHQFFDAADQLVVADIGHFESEQFTKELFFELLTKKLPNFAVRLSNVNSNPIKYL